MKNNDLVKKFTFAKDEKETLEDIELGLINAKATIMGLSMYKKAYLDNIYKRLGITKEKKGYTQNIEYNLSLNQITYTETLNKNVKK